MISKAYEKADFEIIAFAIDDVLTASNVVHTTVPSTTSPNTTTTLPGTTSSGGVQVGGGDIIFDFSDFFQ